MHSRKLVLLSVLVIFFLSISVINAADINDSKIADNNILPEDHDANDIKALETDDKIDKNINYENTRNLKESDKKTAEISMKSDNVSYGNNLILNANISDTNNKKISEGQYYIYLNGNLVKSSNLTGGIVYNNFGVLNSGTYKINLLFKSSNYNSVSKSIYAKVSKNNAKLTVNAPVVYYGDNLEVFANITNSNNQKVTGGHVYVYIDGNLHKSVNINSGTISDNFGKLNVSSHKINILYKSPNYNSVSKTVTGVINKVNATISLKSNSVNYGDELIVKANITNSSNKLLTDGTVNIYANGNLKESFNITQGSISKSLGKLPVGTYKINLLYKSKNYNSVSKSVIVTVNKSNAKINVQANTVNYGDELIVKANITDSNNKLVDNGQIYIYNNGNLKESFNISYGEISQSLGKLDAGTQIINVLYKSNSYNSISKTVKTSVKKVTPVISIYADNTNYGDKNNLSVNVSYANHYVNEGNITVFIDGNIYYQKNYSGPIEIPLNPATVGKHKINVLYQSSNYNSVSKTIVISVDKAAAYLETQNKIITDTENAYVTANIKDKNGRPVTEGNLTISVNGIQKTIVSNKNGSVSYNLGKLPTNIYKIMLNFTSNHYNSVTKSATIHVKNYHVYMNSQKGYINENIYVPIDVRDELNNTVNGGEVSLYLNNTKYATNNIVNGNTKITLSGLKQGTYILTATYKLNNYTTTSKTALTVNPKNSYNLRFIHGTLIQQSLNTRIRGLINNTNSANTINSGYMKFYINDKYIDSENTRYNLSSVSLKEMYTPGNYTFRVEYYDSNNNFITADSQILEMKTIWKQETQETFLAINTNLVDSQTITTTKKDVYFVMDRTAGPTDYNPNDMKIMNNIASQLKANGFNVKEVNNGPGETYETAKRMYYNNVKNSILFILCNGVDANVIREYLIGNDYRLTAVRNRGNDVVMGWFFGAGDIINPNGEYYHWLPKAWDDNYSNKGGMSHPRSVMEKDGIKFTYEKIDITGDATADAFIKLYGGKVTQKVSQNSTITLKTNIYHTNSNLKTNGNLVFYLNNEIIKNTTINTNQYTFTYKLSQPKGTYNLKVEYYSNNQLITKTNGRYITIY